MERCQENKCSGATYNQPSLLSVPHYACSDWSRLLASDTTDGRLHQFKCIPIASMSNITLSSRMCCITNHSNDVKSCCKPKKNALKLYTSLKLRDNGLDWSGDIKKGTLLIHIQNRKSARQLHSAFCCRQFLCLPTDPQSQLTVEYWKAEQTHARPCEDTQ